MEPFDKKKQEVGVNVLKEALKNQLTKKKKPVKFTWKGFANLASGFLETNPFDKLKLERIKELQEGSKA